MASVYIGINRGAQDQGPDAITEGASTGSTDVEVRIDTGKSLTRKDVILILEKIEGYIADGRMTFFTL